MNTNDEPSGQPSALEQWILAVIAFLLAGGAAWILFR